MLLKKTIQAWFISTVSILLFLIITYIVSHAFWPGAEVVRLSKQEITDINLILFGANDSSNAIAAVNLQRAGDSTATLSKSANTSSKTNNNNNSIQLVLSNNERKATVYRYLFSIRRPYSSSDSANFVSYFSDYNLQQFAAVLSNYPIKVKSYFWLTDKLVYLEIIFWTWFGLISSLLYHISEAVRTSKFDRTEISVHIAKFFYAPISALIIYFSIDILVSKGDITVSEFSHGTVVLAFILGFFSGRTIELLNKIKDLILPLGKQENIIDVNTSTTTLEKTKEAVFPAFPPSFSPNSNTHPPFEEWPFEASSEPPPNFVPPNKNK